MPVVKEPRYFASDQRSHGRSAPAPRAGPQTLEQYARAVRRRRARGSCVGEASPQYLRSRAAAGAIAEVRPGAQDHRDPARAGELPALVPPADGLQRRRDRARLRARRSRSSPSAARGRHIPRGSPPPGSRCCTPNTSATSSSCAASTTHFPPRAGAGADLRGLPRRQRGDACAACCASSASTSSSPSPPIETAPGARGALRPAAPRHRGRCAGPAKTPRPPGGWRGPPTRRSPDRLRGEALQGGLAAGRLRRRRGRPTRS